MKRLLLIVGLLLLFAAEILRVYFIMPFPGSQKQQTIDIAFWLHNNIWWLRILGLILIAYPVYQVLTLSRRWKKIITGSVLVLYFVVFFFFNYRFQADKMFYQPTQTNMALAPENKVPLTKLVVGIEANGESKAYPIQYIGYHHQVRDNIGGEPVMVTYCTVCRTGRVYSPLVKGRPETFRLVGMDHFNAMFEDATTKSWWQQATGVAISGPLKGMALKEIPSRQMTLGAWLSSHPGSSIMQGDTTFKKDYNDLADYDNGTIESDLEYRDSLSWKDKSWVVGVAHNGNSIAYDWNELVSKQLLEDSLPGLPLLLVLESDTASFHAWNRSFGNSVLRFKPASETNTFIDNTGSAWNMQGRCIAGANIGMQLSPIQAYQEFWHSWKTFHPDTRRHNSQADQRP